MIDPSHPARTNEFPRISERYVCVGIKHQWQLPTGRGLRKKHRVEWVTVDVLDITVAGARVIGPATRGLTSGTRFPLRWDGDQGVGQIRHVQPAVEDDYALYGVLFARLSPELERRIFEAVAGLRHTSSNFQQSPTNLDEHWNNAR